MLKRRYTKLVNLLSKKTALEKSKKFQKFRFLKNRYYFFNFSNLDILLSGFTKQGKKLFLEKHLYRWANSFRKTLLKRFDTAFRYFQFFTLYNIEMRSGLIRNKEVLIPKAVDLRRATGLWNKFIVKLVALRLSNFSFSNNFYSEFYKFYRVTTLSKLYEYTTTIQKHSSKWKSYSHYRWKK